MIDSNKAGGLGEPSKQDIEKAKAKKLWNEHEERQRKMGLRTVTGLALIGVLGVLGYVALSPAPPAPPPPKTQQQKMDESAQFAKEHPDDVLAQRLPLSTMSVFDPKEPKVLKSPSKLPSKGTEVVKPIPFMPSLGKLAVETLPSKDLLEKVKRENAGKTVLAVGSDGYATLPNGERVKVASVSVPQSAQVEASVAQMDKAKMQTEQSTKELAQYKSAHKPMDKNGVEAPLTIDDVLKARAEAAKQHAPKRVE